ncbi:MAG TPA: RNA polymerase factor sigma-54 [Mesorhizobium sp.]|jgi:RNA polymerase sigma-54 factor
MALVAKLQLRQSQSLVMTPQLMQSIRLLQLTHVELEQFIEAEIERNPLIERAESADDDRGGDAVEQAAEHSDGDGEVWFEDAAVPSAEAFAEGFDSSMENVFPDDPGSQERVGPTLTETWKSSAGAGPGTGGSGEGFDLEDIAAAKITLRDHISEQIVFAFLDPSDRLVAADLTDELDEAGYFRGDLALIAERLGVPPHEAERVLLVCQTFEPTGIFARTVAECLALQLAVRDRLDPAMRALLANLELLARRDFSALRKICGVDDEDLLDMAAEIRALDPRPGTAFTSGVADTVVPDVTVRAASDGSWTVELNSETLPRVLVDNIYYAQVLAKTKQAAEREFLTECMQNANWLTRSLDQRAKTILKVSTEIVRQQDGFMANGVRHLRPLNLKTIADAIGMHESTVSRVTTNKFMQTPRGVFELRYFFTAALASAEGGEAHSAAAVRDRIRELVEAEKPADVLSDDTIADILKEGGVDIARRTVAKYRESMSIASSVQRRREKQALASVGR